MICTNTSYAAKRPIDRFSGEDLGIIVDSESSALPERQSNTNMQALVDACQIQLQWFSEVGKIPPRLFLSSEISYSSKPFETTSISIACAGAARA